jgi:hypothetical protein
MRKLALVAAGFAVLAAVSYFGLVVYPSQRFRAALDQEIGRLPAGITATYASASYSLLTHKAEIADLSVKADRPYPWDARFGAVTIRNPNLGFPAAWAEAAQNAAVRPDESLPVADSVTARAISVHAGATTVTNDLVSIARLRVYPATLQHVGVPDVVEAIAEASARPQASLTSLLPLIRLEAAVTLGLAYDS